MAVVRPTRSWLLVAPALIVLGWGGNHFLPLMQYYRLVQGFSQVQVDILLGAYVFGIVPGFALSGAWSDRHGRRPVLLAGLVLGIVGSIVQVWIVLVAAPVFGAGYGLAMVFGLSTTQSLARPEDLAGITAAYYSLTYLGFLLPAALAALSSSAPMGVLLGATAAVCALCTAVAAWGIRRTGAPTP